MRNRLLALSLFSATVALALAIASAASAQTESTLDKVKRTGEMLIGVRGDGPPMGSRDEKGNFQGFAVDLARAMAERLGVKATFVPSTSQTRIPLLQGGRIDAEFGTTTPTKQREEVVDFSIMYNWDVVLPLVRAGDSKKPADYGPPKKVSTTQGNLAATLFKNIVPNAEVVFFPEYNEGVLALLGKKVDAVLTNKFVADSWIKKHPGQLALGEPFFTDPQAIMMRENDSKWRKTINWMLQELWHEGKFQKMYEAHFGYAPDFALWSDRGLQPGIVK